MARRLRLHVAGGYYHVTLRGNHRQAIFFAEVDRELLDSIVAEALDRLAARLHAYCWMTNHIHLLVQVSEAPLWQLMHRIASRYARKVQASKGTTGHLFERRHYPVLVDADNYLLTLVRYIHLNPVRAGLVSDPGAYPWSSHQDYLGVRHRSWITTRMALGLLSEKPLLAVARYRRFVGESDDCHWGTGTLKPHSANVHILGDDAFVTKVLRDSSLQSPRKSLDQLISEGCERFHLTAEALASPSRARHLAAARAWIANQAVPARVASICDVARRMGRSESAIRQLMSRHPITPDDE